MTTPAVHSVESTEIMEWDGCGATGAKALLTHWELALRNGKNMMARLIFVTLIALVQVDNGSIAMSKSKLFANLAT